MTEISINTPALIFPAISLLLLAYTNRYVAISNRIRILYAQYEAVKNDSIVSQILILKRRIKLIRDMQLAGIMSIFCAAFTMFLLFIDFNNVAAYSFFISIVLLMVSLGMAAFEVILSNKALDIQLNDIVKELNTKNKH